MQSIGKKNTKKTKIITTIIFVAVLAGIAAFYLLVGIQKNGTDKAHTEDVIEKSNNSSGGGVTSPKDSSKTDQESAPPDQSIRPTKPMGTFVSNHHPNLSGSPAPNAITSTCTTTPGASCTIRFTKDNVVKSLSPQTTDSNGNISWDWKLQDIGLTVGTWKIVAVATIGKNVVETLDTLDLVVGD